MKFYLKINKTALFLAIEKENIEIIKLLMSNENIDINIINVFLFIDHKIHYQILS